jgi:hypothetical protein
MKYKIGDQVVSMVDEGDRLTKGSVYTITGIHTYSFHPYVGLGMKGDKNQSMVKFINKFSPHKNHFKEELFKI